MPRMTTPNFVNLFQAVGLFGLVLTAISFVGLWIFTSRLDAEKDKKIREIGDTAKGAQAGEQPVTHLLASVHIEGAGNKKGYSERRDSGGNVALLQFGQSSIMSKDRGPWVIGMVADKVDLWGNDQSCDYFLDFRSDHIHSMPTGTASEFLGKIDMFSMHPWFFEMNTDIRGGSVVLVVNSVLQKKFSIKPQSTGEFMTISNESPSSVPDK
jgi:hypothetical protein